MIVSSLPGILVKTVIFFWAAGPQLAICLWLAYATCRRRSGRMLEWLIGGFAAALLPIAGVVVMIVLFRHAGRDRAQGSGGPAGGGGRPAEAAGGAASPSDRLTGAGGQAASPADRPVAGAGTR